jgi:hypothetical protein
LAQLLELTKLLNLDSNRYSQSKFCRSKLCRSKFLSVKILVGQNSVGQNSRRSKFCRSKFCRSNVPESLLCIGGKNGQFKRFKTKTQMSRYYPTKSLGMPKFRIMFLDPKINIKNAIRFVIRWHLLNQTKDLNLS